MITTDYNNITLSEDDLTLIVKHNIRHYFGLVISGLDKSAEIVLEKP